MKNSIVLISLFFLLSCNNDGESTSTTSVAKSNIPDARTLNMIDKVRLAEKNIDPLKIAFYMNQERAILYGNRINSSQGMDKMNIMIQYSSELLKSGQTQKAIKQMNTLFTGIKDLDFVGKQNVVLKMKQILAISYMRLGEQENCLANHNSASCVIPIAEEAYHTKPQGSTEAIKLYKEILELNPDDLQSKYLLNIACMTLGKYPDEVPPQFLIPESYFYKSSSLNKFTDIAGGLGIDQIGLAGGVCTEDFNNDGHLDIICSSWGFGHQLQYFENSGDGSFIDRTSESRLTGVSGGLNIKHGDFNNDGFEDVLVLRGAWFNTQGKIPNSLLQNNGDGTFTDITVEAGFYSEKPTQTAAIADFDLDGHLDIYIGNESERGGAFPNEFYHNNGDGTFEEIASQIGLNYQGFCKGVAAGDINNDRLPDLYISVLGTGNMLLKNSSTKDRIAFQNISVNSGTLAPSISFPCWFFDFNNDELEDIFVSSYADVPESGAYSFAASINQASHRLRPRLYINLGNNTFLEKGKETGFTESALTMGSNYGDLDNDGYLDIFLGTGEPNFNTIVPNKVYRNLGGNKVEDVTYASGFGHIQKGHGVGFGDFDHDGDQDIYAVMGGSFNGDVFRNVFYENPNEGKNNWTCLDLIGTKSNKSAIGAKLVLKVNDDGEERKIVRTVSSGSSFGGNSLQLEIGLGQATQIKQLTIFWPNAEKTTSAFADLPVNRKIIITEGENKLAYGKHKAFKFKPLTHKHH